MLLITNEQVDRAAHIIDTGQVAQLLARAIAFKPQGRPRRLTLRTWLIGAYLAIENDASFKNTTIHTVLTRAISREKQAELGVRYTTASGREQVIGKDKVDYISRWLPKRLAYTTAAAQRWDLDIDHAEMRRRQDGLDRALTSLLQASLATEGGSWYALDGSGTWSWGRSKYRVEDADDVRTHETVTDDTVLDGATDLPPTETSTCRKVRGNHDPEAAIGSKTSKSGRRESFYGFMLDAAIRVSGPDEPAQPVVVERLQLSPASTDVVDPTLKMLDSLLETPGGVTDVCVDRHYSYKRVERWADELRKRGISQHFDLRSDEQGFRDVNGMRLAAGWMHCPATPDELGTINRPPPGAPIDTREEFARRIEQRRSWAMDRHERVNRKGRSRWTCPAVAGSRGCPLRPGTVEVAREAGLPIVQQPPAAETAPKCCTNASGIVSDNSDEMRKHQQPHYWGSPEWKIAYDLRTYVEGMFGSLKNPDTEGVRRGFTKFVGLVMVSLGLTLAAAAANVRHQRKFWEDRSDRPDHPLLTPDPTFHGWAALTDPDVAPTANTAGAMEQKGDRDHPAA